MTKEQNIGYKNSTSDDFIDKQDDSKQAELHKLALPTADKSDLTPSRLRVLLTT